MDRKLFVKTSSDIAKTQIKKLWGHLTCICRPTHWYIVVSLSIWHQWGYTSSTVFSSIQILQKIGKNSQTISYGVKLSYGKSW